MRIEQENTECAKGDAKWEPEQENAARDDEVASAALSRVCPGAYGVRIIHGHTVNGSEGLN